MHETIAHTEGYNHVAHVQPDAIGGATGAEGYLLHFIFSEKRNRTLLWIALGGIVVQFIVFKMLYPFPDFISDSYSYIDTNLYHMDANLWPIGYSIVLRLIHTFTSSDTFLISIQYFLLEGSLFYFCLSILYWYNLSKASQSVLFIFLFCNPLFLYLSNAVLSDALFSSLSIILFTQMLWMIHRPRMYYIFTLALLVGLLFTLRYTAVYYPLITAIAFLFSKQAITIRISGIILPFLFIIPFVIFTQEKTKQATGTAQFSVFGGWQIANNALYMYDHINIDSNHLPEGTKPLDRLVRQYFKRVPTDQRELSNFPGTFFIKMPDAPLKQYMFFNHQFKDSPGQFAAWGKVSPIYKAYGEYLIIHHPIAFLRYYLLLNAKNYFFPHLEKFEIYNLGMNTVWSAAQYWFGYKSPDIAVVSPDLQGKIFYLFPGFFLTLNLFFTCFFSWIFLTGKLKRLDPAFRKILWLVICYLIINFTFSVFATPVVLRYEIIPMIFLFTFSILLVQFGDDITRQPRSLILNRRSAAAI